MSLINTLPDIINECRKAFREIMESDYSGRFAIDESTESITDVLRFGTGDLDQFTTDIGDFDLEGPGRPTIDARSPETEQFPQSLDVQRRFRAEGPGRPTIDAVPKFCTEKIGESNDAEKGKRNIIAWGDNLCFMKFLIDEKKLKGKVRLIYIDPPFFTKAIYGADFKLRTGDIKSIPAIKQKAYSDTWEEGMEEYLKMIALRLMLMRELLTEDGSIFVHLDWHAVHYVKVLMDEIFGYENFVNEIIWNYKSGGASTKRFARKHDTILFYGKTDKYHFMPGKEKSYNRGYKPYRFKGVKEYRDEFGWYTLVNRKDVWQIDMVGRTSAERTGYATQKPEILIERILESCTKEGDLCADFFGGSGTMASAAEKMGRNWISCDIGKLATVSTRKRLLNAKPIYDYYEEIELGFQTIQDQKRGQDSKSSQQCSLPEFPTPQGLPGLALRPKPTNYIKADVSITSHELSDKKILKTELLEYHPGNVEELPIEKKYLPYVKEAIKEDSLQFISFWCIDWNYKSGIATPRVYILKEAKGMDTVYETIGSSFGPVLIRVVDIFGNTAEKLIML